MRAAIYARYSSDKQSDASIEDQIRNCVWYAERNDMTVITKFADRAITGAVKVRQQYQEMRASAERGEFDVLLVDDLSRLSRDEIEVKQLIRRFKFAHIRIIGVSEGYDSGAKGEKIQSTMRGLMNELYLDDLREKTHRGLYGKALKGYSAGGSCYGYRRVPIESMTKLDSSGRPLVEAVRRAINEDEAKWVRQIFQWYASGYSSRWIAAELNRLKVLSPRGSTWATSAIYGDMAQGNGLLNNQMYIGHYIWNRSEWVKDPDTGKRRRIERKESEWVITDMPELRIVPQSLWNAVKARQAQVRHNSSKLREVLNNPDTHSRSGKYLFSGLLKCGCCGANFVMRDVRSYACGTNINRGDAACSNRLTVPRHLVETLLLDAVHNELFSGEAIAAFVKETSSALKKAQAEAKPAQSGYQRQLAQAEKEIANLMSAIKAGIITPSTKEELERAEASRTQAQSALKAASAAPAAKLADILPDAEKRYQAFLADFTTTLARDVSLAREHLKTLIGSVTLNPRPEGYLEAELGQSLNGLMKLSVGKDLPINLVAGTGFEPVTFRL